MLRPRGPPPQARSLDGGGGCCPRNHPTPRNPQVAHSKRFADHFGAFLDVNWNHGHKVVQSSVPRSRRIHSAHLLFSAMPSQRPNLPLCIRSFRGPLDYFGENTRPLYATLGKISDGLQPVAAQLVIVCRKDRGQPLTDLALARLEIRPSSRTEVAKLAGAAAWRPAATLRRLPPLSHWRSLPPAIGVTWGHE